jgi:hypothetical protein
MGRANRSRERDGCRCALPILRTARPGKSVRFCFACIARKSLPARQFACVGRRICRTESTRLSRSSSVRENICLSLFRKLWISCRIPPRQEGRIANVTTREAGMRWTRRHRRRPMLTPTAKSCGPGAPMQAPSWRRCFRVVACDGGKRWFTKSRISRKPSRREGRLLPPVHVVHARSRNFLCAGAPGAAATRPSLRPLHRRGRWTMQSSGETRRENADSYPLCWRGGHASLCPPHRLPIFATDRFRAVGRGLRRDDEKVATHPPSSSAPAHNAPVQQTGRGRGRICRRAA